MTDVARASPILPPRPLAPPVEDPDGNVRATAAGDFDTFLRLLTAQLKNQDPMQPIESTEFVAQLASFSTVEQLIAANERIDSLAAGLRSGELASLAQWIGGSAAATDGGFVATGEPVAFRVADKPGATRVTAEIVDGSGTVLAAFGVDPSAGEATWDGRAANGGVPLGERLTVQVRHLAGEELLSLSAAPVFREVVGLRGGQDGTLLDLSDGGTLAPGDVAELRLAPDE